MTTNFAVLGAWQKISRDLGFSVKQGDTYYAGDNLRSRFYLFDEDDIKIGDYGSQREAWFAAAEIAHDIVMAWMQQANALLSLEKSWMEQGDL